MARVIISIVCRNKIEMLPKFQWPIISSSKISELQRIFDNQTFLGHFVLETISISTHWKIIWISTNVDYFVLKISLNHNKFSFTDKKRSNSNITLSIQTKSKPTEQRRLISRGFLYSLLFSHFKSPRLASSQQVT